MKVLITGGAGDIGRVTTRWLIERGWQVRVLDRAAQLDIVGIDYVSGDISQFAVVREAIRDCEAVIHLAALRNPFMRPGQEVFEVNTAGTFNVYEAAAQEGIKRIAQASSINALGCAWNSVDIEPQYFPIDEQHPTFTVDPYSFSKQMVEEIGDYYWRRDKISSVSMRFPWVYPEGHIESERFLERCKLNRTLLDDLLAMGDTERAARLAKVREHTLAFRAERWMETPNAREHQPIDDPLWAVYTFDRFNYWTFVDVRDAAQSLEKGLTANYEGHHALFINDPHNWLDTDTRTLIKLFYPEVKQIRESLSGSESLVSIEKARALIGFEPAYSVRRQQA